MTEPKLYDERFFKALGTKPLIIPRDKGPDIVVRADQVFQAFYRPEKLNVFLRGSSENGRLTCTWEKAIQGFLKQIES
jgi:hypothetical protein